MNKWSSLLWVFAGGGMGAVLRVLLDSFWNKYVRFPLFPSGIILVNLIGCLLMGILYGCYIKGRDDMGSWVFPLLGAGLLGGFTTFSTFGMQTLLLLKEDKPLAAALYVAVSVLGGLGCVFIGYWMANR